MEGATTHMRLPDLDPPRKFHALDAVLIPHHPTRAHLHDWTSTQHRQHSTIMDIAAELLETGKYSDLTIKCGDRSFKVHKALVCLKSAVVAAECDTNMMERQTGVIDHSVFDADTVMRLLQFVYLKTYDVAAPEESKPTQNAAMTTTEGDVQDQPSGEKPERDAVERQGTAASFIAKLVAHVHVYGIGDYYAMPDLQRLALTQFLDLASANWPALAANEFVEVVEQVCKITSSGETDGLRATLLDIIAGKSEILATNDVFITKLGDRAELQTFLAEIFRRCGPQLMKQPTEREALEEQVKQMRQKFETAEAYRRIMLQCINNMPLACKNTGCHRKPGGGVYCDFFGPKHCAIRCSACKCRLVEMVSSHG